MKWKDGRLQLPNVTLMAMTSVNVRQTIKAMQYSMRQIDFGDCVLITHRKPFFLPKGIRYAHTNASRSQFPSETVTAQPNFKFCCAKGAAHSCFTFSRP